MQRFVILGDFVRSRKIERRSEFAGVLGSVLEELNARYRDAFQSPLQITKGINGTDIESAEDLASRVQQVGSNTIVDLGNGDTITLVNVNADDVNSNPNDYFSVH